jgi:hypothetical protein
MMEMSSPAMMAEQEELGDLKLYRIPRPVTVAAKSQKQVALLERRGVKVEQVYRHRLYLSNLRATQPVERVIIARNTAAGGLGLPLPSGRVMLSAKAGDRPLLIGRGTMTDYAVGEDVEIVVGVATAVNARLVPLGPIKAGSREWELVVDNSSALPVRYEAELEATSLTLASETALARRDGRPLWTATIPAKGSATLRFRSDTSPQS